MKFNPHKYQDDAFAFAAARTGALLALEMGLGKSVIAASLASHFLGTMECRRCLIVAPKRVAQHTWPAEFAKWDHLRHLRVGLILGSPERRLKEAATDYDVHIINRENIAWLVRNVSPKRWSWDMLVIDESTSFKDVGSQRFRALRAIRDRFNRVYLLSGTPVSQSYIDLWAQMFLADKGESLGKSFVRFRERCFESDFLGYKWTLREGFAEKIHKRIADTCLSMRVGDHLDMPEFFEIDIYVDVPKSALEMSAELLKEKIVEMEDGPLTAISAAAAHQKLSQIANGFVYRDKEDGSRAVEHIHDAKIEALQEVVEAAGGEPVLIVYHFQEDLKRLRAAFPQGMALVDGDHTITAWNYGALPQLFLHPESGGEGLNLQDGGHHIVWLAPEPSLRKYRQTNARLFRQGQKSKSVIVHRLVAKGTVDEGTLGVMHGRYATLVELFEATKRRMEDE